jgi:tetratricopeptide (TPR) repeat protein
MSKRIVIFIILVVGIFAIWGCGPKQRAAEGLLDTPESHYNQGMRKLDQGALDEAQAQFEDAIKLKAKYGPAYAGLALVNAYRGAAILDLKSKDREKYFELGEDQLDKAQSLDSKNTIPWIAHIRFYALQKEDDDWIDDCLKGLKKAVDINPKCDEAYYYMGLAHKNNFDFKAAEDALKQALEIDGQWSEKATIAMQTIQKIVLAQPGTKYGKIIALQDNVNRADLAVLFIEELNVVERLKRREAYSSTPDLTFKSENPQEYPGQKPVSRNEVTDISGHWAESMIGDYIEVGLFDVMQDHKFYPNEVVSRIEFAGSVQKLIYMVTADKSIFSKYIGEKESHIKDMRSDHPYYGAAMLCVERNIMSLDKMSGEFHPNADVSGPDALLIIRDIKNALKW